MYIEQAYKGDNTTWKIIVTTILSTGIFVANFVFLLIMSPEDLQNAYDLAKNLPPIVNLISNLVPFVFLLLMLIAAVILLHKRSFVSLTTARKKIDFKRIAFSASLIIGLTLILFAVSYYLAPDELEWNFKPIKFLILVVVSLILFPFQIGFEEYLFRGYLMQQIGILVKNKWFPLLLTSILFGLLHSANPEVAEMGFITMVLYIGFGLLMGIMTLMDDGLELALGFHFGNNLMAAFLVTSDWSAIQADALFRNTAQSATGDMIIEMLLSVFITFPIMLFVLARKYEWKNWKQKLTGKVLTEEEFANKYRD